MSDTVLKLDNVTKSFGPVEVIKGVDLDVRYGQIQALLGENGAGKSTLIKMIAGVHEPDSGRILIDGSEVKIPDTKASEAFGIATIHQELNLVPTMSVAENIMLGRTPNKFGLVNRKHLKAQAKAALDLIGLDVDLNQPVSELGIAKQWPDSTAYLSPIGFIVGAAGFASAFMPRLWRRRFRITIVSLTATYVLYSGTLSDALGIITAVISITAGQLLMKPAPDTPSIRERRVLIAVCVACVAIGPAFIALDPLAQGPFSEVTRLLWEPNSDTLDLAHAHGIGPMVANLLPLILQLVFCFGLVRGRITAWRLAVASQVIALALLTYQLWNTNPSIPSLIPVTLPWLCVLGILLANRRLFRTHENRTYLLETVLLSTLIALVGAGLWIGIALLHDPLPRVLAETPLRFLPTIVAMILPHYVIPASSISWFVYEWIGNAFWIFVAFRLYRGFSRPTDPAHEEDLRTARRLLESGTGDHLSFMTLWKSNRYFFHEDSYVAYRVSNGIALTLGSPIGNDISAEFSAFASDQGWDVAWYSVGADFAASHPELKNVQVAEEAVLPCRTVEFKGKKFQNIRTARNKAVKEGIHTRWTCWNDIDLATIAKITALSEEWVADKALPEMGFTLGGLEEMKVPGTRLLVAEDQDGTLHGLTSWMPVFEKVA